MASVTRSQVEFAVGKQSGQPYDVMTRCFKEKHDKFWGLTGAAAEAFGASRIADVCGKGENFLGFAQAFSDIGTIVNEVTELCEEEGTAVEKVAQAGKVIGATADGTITGLSLLRFTSDMVESESFQGSGMQVGIDSANMVSCACSIFDSSLELAAVASRESQPRTDYEVEVDEMTKHKSIWDLVKNIASFTGSALGIIGVITAAVLSSWITLGISVVVFIGAIVSFFIGDQLERFQQEHEIDEIMTSLTKKR